MVSSISPFFRSSLNCSLLGVFSTEAEEEEVKAPVAPLSSALDAAALYPQLRNEDFACLGAWSTRCLRSVADLADARCFLDHLLPPPLPPGHGDSCVDEPRVDSDLSGRGASQAKAMADAVELAMQRSLLSTGDLSAVAREVEAAEILERLPEGLTKPEVTW